MIRKEHTKKMNRRLILLLVCLTGIALATGYYVANREKNLQVPEIFSHLPGREITGNSNQPPTPGLPDKEPETTDTPGMTAPPPQQALGDTADRQQLQKEIEARYGALLLATASTYEGKLNNLIASGWNEYRASKNRGSNISALLLARKYIPAGYALEAECDAHFYAVLDNFKAELKRNSLPTTAAELAAKEYEKAKTARKKQILAKALQSQ